MHEDPGEPYGAPQPRLYLPVNIADRYQVAHQYAVDVWIGKGATQMDKEIARLIVASIRVGPQVPYFVPGPSPSPSAP